MIMTSQKEGLWAHFIDLIPMPERSEYLSLIGRSLMDTNETLWNEKAVLQEIVYEIQGKSSISSPLTSKTNIGSFSPKSLSSSYSSSVFTTVVNNNGNYQANINNSQPTTARGGKFHAKRLFNDALSYSHVHYNNDELNELVNVSISSFEYLDDLQRILRRKYPVHISDIQPDLQLLRDYLILENEKLQEFIQSLQSIIEKDSFQDDFSLNSSLKPPVMPINKSVERPQTLPSSNAANKLIDSKIPKKSIKSSGNSNLTYGSSMDDKSYFESKSKELAESAFFDGDELSLNLQSMSKPYQQNNNKSDSLECNSQPSSRKSSRFREKLKDAQAELFLVDDL